MTSETTAANGLVLATSDGGGVISFCHLPDPLRDGRKGIGVYLPNGMTVNLGLIAVAQIHQFFGAWLEDTENAG